jgi:predicted dehydrogenase
MATPLRIGVVGAGAIATYGHIPGFQKLPGVEVAAVCDANLERAQATARRFGIPTAHADYHELVANPDIDAISIGVPNVLHAPVAIAALQTGKHVLSEKPLATTVADGQAMVAAAEQAGRVLAVNMNNRVRADTNVLRAAVADGRLGKIGYVNARMLRRSGIPGYGSWFTRRDLSGGGVLMDLGVHMLDLSLWLLGFPKVAAVRGETQAIHGPRGRGLGGWGVDHISGGTFDVEDFAAIHLRLAEGGLVTVEAGWALYGRDEQRVQLYGDEGGADISSELYGAETPLRLFRDEAGVPAEVIPALPRLAGSEWDRSMGRFVAAIRGEGEPTATGVEALVVLELLDAAYRSAAEGREISIS